MLVPDEAGMDEEKRPATCMSINIIEEERPAIILKNSSHYPFLCNAELWFANDINRAAVY